jgi:hypothetical protein
MPRSSPAFRWQATVFEDDGRLTCIAGYWPGDRLIAAFLLGCVLFNYPLLDDFSIGHRCFPCSTKSSGFPWSIAYVFFAWASSSP